MVATRSETHYLRELARRGDRLDRELAGRFGDAAVDVVEATGSRRSLDESDPAAVVDDALGVLRMQTSGRSSTGSTPPGRATAGRRRVARGLP